MKGNGIFLVFFYYSFLRLCHFFLANGLLFLLFYSTKLLLSFLLFQNFSL